MYPYEILVIFDPRPTDEDVAALLVKLQDNLKGLGAEVGKAESWGKRRLAYEIRKQREGTYAVIECSADSGDDQGIRATARAQRAGPALSFHPCSAAEAGAVGAEAAARGG